MRIFQFSKHLGLRSASPVDISTENARDHVAIVLRRVPPPRAPLPRMDDYSATARDVAAPHCPCPNRSSPSRSRANRTAHRIPVPRRFIVPATVPVLANFAYRWSSGMGRGCFFDIRNSRTSTGSSDPLS